MLEFQLKYRPNYAMWELSPLLNQNYWCVMSSDDAGGNVTVAAQDVIKVLRGQLGVVQPDGYYVDLDYDFPSALKEV